MLDVFQQWFQARRATLEADGITFEFYGHTEKQTVRANNLNLSYSSYESGVCLWETGECNIDLVDMEADATEPMDECSSFVELRFGNPSELELALDLFFKMLVELPSQDISVRAALFRYWQSLPAYIHQ